MTVFARSGFRLLHHRKYAHRPATSRTTAPATDAPTIAATGTPLPGACANPVPLGLFALVSRTVRRFFGTLAASRRTARTTNGSKALQKKARPTGQSSTYLETAARSSRPSWCLRTRSLNSRPPSRAVASPSRGRRCQCVAYLPVSTPSEKRAEVCACRVGRHTYANARATSPRGLGPHHSSDIIGMGIPKGARPCIVSTALRQRVPTATMTACTVRVRKESKKELTTSYEMTRSSRERRLAAGNSDRLQI